MTASRIGVVTLNNFILNPGVTFPDSVKYMYLVSEKDFYTTFSMTKTIANTAPAPNFNSQCVVAVVLQPSKRVITMAIDKAEITGKDLNIYYSVTDTTSWTTYSQTPQVAATVPRSMSITNVNFYRQNVKERTLPVVY